MSFRGNRLRNILLQRRLYFWVLAVLLLLTGLAIRLFDITDPTFQTRQLHGAVLARGMYYKMNAAADPRLRELAISFWKSTTQYELPLLEKLAAYTYLLAGSEQAWIGRMYSSFFWVLGGIGLVALSRRMFSGIASDRGLDIASLACLGFYLLSPFAVESSRDFQSDPGMVMWTIFYLYALFVWIDRRSWTSALACGFLGGIAILVKVTAAFILLPAFAALMIYGSEWKRSLKSVQAWLILLLFALPTVIYMLTSKLQGDALTYFENTTLAVSSLLSRPTFYVSWINFLNRLISLPVLLLGFLGVALSPARTRLLFVFVWIGYVIYGAVFPHQIYTHDYYHLRMVPLVALTLIPVLSILLDKIDLHSWLNRGILLLAALLAVAYPLWVSYSNFTKVDNRAQAARWQEIGAALPADGKIVALAEEYGFPLMYYGWRKVALWPSLSEQELKALRGNPRKFERLTQEYARDFDYFLVTDMKEFELDSQLRQWLYENFTLVIEEPDYLLFDLKPGI